MRYPNLLAEMKRRGITQGELAEAVGVTQATVSRWFQGHRTMSVTSSFKIKEKLFPDLSIDYLFADRPANVGQ